MTCTDAQVRLLMRERTKGRSQEQAAVKANLKSRKTVAKYERLGQLPSELKRPRTYRTRSDPFNQAWPMLEQMLLVAPELEAKTLFDWLCEQQPGQYQAGQLRTLQRRVSDWRALHQEQIAIIEQVHRPGGVLQSDGVWLTELGVTIAGELFRHVLIHCVLPYSNWEWGAVAQSESQLAYQRAIQATLLKLGAVPQEHQTDNSSAVTHQVSRSAEGERAYNPAYLALLKHYGMTPRTIHLGRPEENGDIEASNGGLKQALRQYLLLRGSSDFSCLAEYEQFIAEVMTHRNDRRQERLAEELAVMKPLTVAPLGPYQEYRVKVSRGSLIRVQKNVYSVPTGLIGRVVTARVYEWHLEVYFRQYLVEKVPRLVGQNRQHLNYRHLIDSLLRKPGGFRDYRYREALFPTLVFRQAWESLSRWYSPRKADLIYLRILRLAARTLESEVEGVLKLLLSEQERWDETEVERRLPSHSPTGSVPQLEMSLVNLAQYDALLREMHHVTA
jgi:transposase InsO family protein